MTSVAVRCAFSCVCVSEWRQLHPAAYAQSIVRVPCYVHLIRWRRVSFVTRWDCDNMYCLTMRRKCNPFPRIYKVNPPSRVLVFFLFLLFCIFCISYIQSYIPSLSTFSEWPTMATVEKSVTRFSAPPPAVSFNVNHLISFAFRCAVRCVGYRETDFNTHTHTHRLLSNRSSSLYYIMCYVWWCVQCSCPWGTVSNHWTTVMHASHAEITGTWLLLLNNFSHTQQQTIEATTSSVEMDSSLPSIVHIYRQQFYHRALISHSLTKWPFGTMQRIL